MAAIVQLIPHMAVVLHLMNNEKAATAGARRKDLRSQADGRTGGRITLPTVEEGNPLASLRTVYHSLVSIRFYYFIPDAVQICDHASSRTAAGMNVGDRTEQFSNALIAEIS
ncbi:unnamed protein product [Onchocerca ochengi]|uniref:Secreted protein n=1 Tax=Onchocerca ochengi TaxID=42157 RepID=A0A182DZ77_ONCOC|nr:unnamed protein product [Onchocerca ochengi]